MTLSAAKASNRHLSIPDSATGLAPSLGREPLSKGLADLTEIIVTLTITQHRSPPFDGEPLRRTFPFSLAVTKGISFDFFSTAELYA